MKIPKLSYFLVFLSIAISNFYVEAATQGQVTVSQSLIVGQPATYKFDIESDQQGTTITINFEPEYTMADGALACTTAGLFTSPTCRIESNKVYIEGIAGSVSFNVEFSINNPNVVKEYNYDVKLFDSEGTNVATATCCFSWTPDPQLLISASITPASDIVGETTKYNVKLTPATNIPVGGKIKLNVPKWEPSDYGAPSYTSLHPDGSIICNELVGFDGDISCSFTRNSGSAMDEIVITNGFFTEFSNNNPLEFELTDILNPCSGRAVTWWLFTLDTGDFAIDGLKNLEVQVNTPNNLKSVVVFIQDNTEIKQLSKYWFEIKSQNPIPAHGKFKIIFPPEVHTMDSEGNLLISTIASSFRLYDEAQLTTNFGNDDHAVMIENGFFQDLANGVNFYLLGNSLFKLSIQILLNPDLAMETSSFQVETYDGNFVIDKKSIGVTVTPTPGPMVSASLTAFTYQVLAITTFRFQFRPKNDLKADAIFKIIFPSEVTVGDAAAGACPLQNRINLDGPTFDCEISNGVITINNPFAADKAGDTYEIQFEVPSVQNPPSSKPSSKFKIQSMTNAGALIDQDSTIIVTAIPNALQNTQITPSNDFTGVSNEYEMKFTTPAGIKQDSIMTIVFPDQLNIVDPTNSANGCSGQGIAEGFQNTVTCAIDTRTLTITNGFTVKSPDGQQSFTIKVPGITNPRSLRSTDTFKIEIKDGEGYGIYEILSGVTLSVTSLSQFNGILFSTGGDINGEVTSYTWKFTPSVPLLDGDVIKITPPSEIKIENPVCTSDENLEPTLVCAMNGSNLQITLKIPVPDPVVPPIRRLAAGEAGTQHSVIVGGITNPPSFRTTVSSFGFETLDQGLYVMNQENSGMTVTNGNKGLIPSGSGRAESVGLGQPSAYIFTFTPANYVPGMSIVLSIPTTLSATSSINCNDVEGFANTPNCSFDAALNEVTLTDGFTSPSKPNLISFKIQSLINPTSYQTTSSFTIQTFDGTFAMDEINADVTVSIFCTSPCLSCTDNRDVCLSCDTNTDTRYLFNNKCLEVCPDGYYGNEFECTPCESPCLDCEGSANTCKSCIAEHYFLDTVCHSSCPIGYEIDGDFCVIETQDTIMPFPFLITSLFVTLMIIFLKCKGNKQTRFTTSSIAIISIVEMAAWIYLIMQLQEKKFINTMYILSIAPGSIILLNWLNIIAYMCWYRKDTEFQIYLQNYRGMHRTILTISSVLNFRFYRIVYSRLGDAKSLSADYQNYDSSFKIMKIYTIVSLALCTFPALGAAGYNFTFVTSKKQIFYTDIEVSAISFYLLILILIEVCKVGAPDPLPVYDKVRGADQSLLQAAPSDAQPYQEKALREQALKSIINQLKAGNEKKLVKAFQQKKNNPKTRLSDPVVKSKFYSDDEELDDRKLKTDGQQEEESEPERDMESASDSAPDPTYNLAKGLSDIESAAVFTDGNWKKKKKVKKLNRAGTTESIEKEKTKIKGIQEDLFIKKNELDQEREMLKSERQQFEDERKEILDKLKKDEEELRTARDTVRGSKRKKGKKKKGTTSKASLHQSEKDSKAVSEEGVESEDEVTERTLNDTQKSQKALLTNKSEKSMKTNKSTKSLKKDKSTKSIKSNKTSKSTKSKKPPTGKNSVKEEIIDGEEEMAVEAGTKEHSGSEDDDKIVDEFYEEEQSEVRADEDEGLMAADGEPLTQTKKKSKAQLAQKKSTSPTKKSPTPSGKSPAPSKKSPTPSGKSPSPSKKSQKSQKTKKSTMKTSHDDPQEVEEDSENEEAEQQDGEQEEGFDDYEEDPLEEGLEGGMEVGATSLTASKVSKVTKKSNKMKKDGNAASSKSLKSNKSGKSARSSNRSEVQQDVMSDSDEEDEEAQDIDNNRKKPKLKPGMASPNEFMFSARSESSIASQMEDTPSNYNQINGRIEGESKGLKVFHTHTNGIRAAQGFLNAGKSSKNRTADGGSVGKKSQSAMGKKSNALGTIREKRPPLDKGPKKKPNPKEELNFVKGLRQDSSASKLSQNSSLGGDATFLMGGQASRTPMLGSDKKLATLKKVHAGAYRSGTVQGEGESEGYDATSYYNPGSRAEPFKHPHSTLEYRSGKVDSVSPRMYKKQPINAFADQKDIDTIEKAYAPFKMGANGKPLTQLQSFDDDEAFGLPPVKKKKKLRKAVDNSHAKIERMNKMEGAYGIKSSSKLSSKRGVSSSKKNTNLPKINNSVQNIELAEQSVLSQSPQLSEREIDDKSGGQKVVSNNFF